MASPKLASYVPLIKVNLSSEGYEVITTENAQQALRLAQSGSFDLYLIDNSMPDLSGDELTRKNGSMTPKPPFCLGGRARVEQVLEFIFVI